MEVEEHAYGNWSSDIEADLEHIHRLCPYLADQLALMLDLDGPADDGPILKGRPVTLFQRGREQRFQLRRSDRGSWRMTVVDDEEHWDTCPWVPRRIFSAAELGTVWYDVSKEYLLPRLHEVVHKLRWRDPNLAVAAFQLDLAWDQARHEAQSEGNLFGPNWRDFVAGLAANP